MNVREARKELGRLADIAFRVRRTTTPQSLLAYDAQNDINAALEHVDYIEKLDKWGEWCREHVQEAEADLAVARSDLKEYEEDMLQATETLEEMMRSLSARLERPV